MDYEIQRFPVDFAGEVRLFPLPNLVFYPGCVQPLHIFESRYCEMIEDALGDDRLLAIATLLPGYEIDYYSRPPISEYVCVGQVVMHERTPQDTHNLILVGACRARIQHEISPVRSFRRAMIDVIEDDLQEEGSEIARRFGERLASRFLSATKSAEPVVNSYGEGQIGLSALTDLVAFHFPLKVSLKLQLLAEPNPLARARLLIPALEGLVAVDSEPADGSQSTESKSSSRPSFPPPFGLN